MIEKMVRVRFIGEKESKQISRAEAQKILDETYDDAVGGWVINVKTGDTIYEVGPEVEEILVINQMLGGG